MYIIHNVKLNGSPIQLNLFNYYFAFYQRGVCNDKNNY